MKFYFRASANGGKEIQLTHKFNAILWRNVIFVVENCYSAAPSFASLFIDLFFFLVLLLTCVCVFLWNPFTGHSIIQILPEIPCKDLQAKDVATLTETTQQLMQQEYERLNAETKKSK